MFKNTKANKNIKLANVHNFNISCCWFNFEMSIIHTAILCSSTIRKQLIAFSNVQSFICRYFQNVKCSKLQNSFVFKISKFQCLCVLKFQTCKTNRNISTKISNFPQLHNFDNKSKHQNKHIKNN